MIATPMSELSIVRSLRSSATTTHVDPLFGVIIVRCVRNGDKLELS